MAETSGGFIVVPDQNENMGGVGDHLNFYLDGATADQTQLFLNEATALGVKINWFCSSTNAR